MGTVRPALDQTQVDKLRELIAEQVANIKAGIVSGFAWTQEEELAELDAIDTILSDSLMDLANGIRR